MSMIQQHVASVKLSDCTKILAARVNDALLHASMKMDDLAALINADATLLEKGLKTGEGLCRSQVQALCLVTGTGLEEIFGLPDLSNQERVIREYNETIATEEGGLSFCDGAGKQVSDVDVARSLLYLRCLRLCLRKYPEKAA